MYYYLKYRHVIRNNLNRYVVQNDLTEKLSNNPPPSCRWLKDHCFAIYSINLSNIFIFDIKIYNSFMMVTGQFMRDEQGSGDKVVTGKELQTLTKHMRF